MKAGASAKYATQFGLMAAFASLAAVFSVTAIAARIVLVWAAVALAVVAVAYATGRPGLLMKRPDGSQPLVAWLVLWPYFLLVRFSLALYRWTNRGHAPAAEVVPGVWFARRLSGREMRRFSVPWTAVLDLTAEFRRAAPPGVAYRALPLLDGTVPSAAQLDDAVAWIDQHAAGGNVLVHCALGHGRTGSVVLAWLLRHGHVADADSGIARLRGLRPTFGLSAAQASALRQRRGEVDT